MYVKRIFRWFVSIFLFVLTMHFVFMMATSSIISYYRVKNPTVTSIMLYRRVFWNWPENKIQYLPLKKIPARTRQMIIRVEDGTFYTHHGVLPSAIKNAWKVNQSLGKTLYGGSTITMQTARTLFLIPEKWYIRKYLEVIIALEMEVILEKDRILELYINYAEWGRGVYGIEAAAQHHYKKGVANLSKDQAIRLVTLLSSPIKYEPYTLHKSAILHSRYKYLTQRFE